MTTYSPPIELRPVCSMDKSPRIERAPISFGDVSPSTPFDMRSMPPEKSSTFSTTPNQQLTASQSIASDKLISLDTPQQTPTAVIPPLIFGSGIAAHKNQIPNAVNDQFIDGNGNGNGSGNGSANANGQIDKNTSNNNHHSNSASNGMLLISPSHAFFFLSKMIDRFILNIVFIGPINPITLDPSTLESYANVQMANAQHDTPSSGNTTNASGNNNDIDKMNAPFTIQGYSDRYTAAKENHSEISC